MIGFSTARAKRSQLTIRAATAKDQPQLARLIHFDAYVHRHLDYRPPLDWIGSDPFSVLEDDGDIAAVLACPPDPPHVAWIHLFAAAYQSSIGKAWDILWPAARTQLKEKQGLIWAAAIPLQNWFETLLEQSGFIQTHQIVMLGWEKQKMPSQRPTSSVTVRPMTIDDLAAVQHIDKLAFVPVWQNSQLCLEFAFRQAAVATVAEGENGLIGYQISTPTPVGGHLARLAVHPQFQNQGIGYALLYDLLAQFEQCGAQIITVNTQKNNLTSQVLYKKVGFRLTGEEYPIYQLEI